MQLRLTRRALADLGLPSELAGRLASSFQKDHGLVTAFVERRSQSPTGQEAIQLPVTRATVYSLHSGRWRGLTWHDENADIVWLLGAGLHRSGERTDPYVVLKARDERGELFPTEDDYLDAEPDPEPFVRSLAAEVPGILEEARQSQGSEIRRTLADAIDVGLIYREGRLWVCLRMPPLAEAALPEEWILVVAAALLRNTPPDEIDWSTPLPHRKRETNEIVMSARVD